MVTGGGEPQLADRYDSAQPKGEILNEGNGKERLVATRERSEAPRNVNTYKFALHVVTTFDTYY